jgi:hypothetical protein
MSHSHLEDSLHIIHTNYIEEARRLTQEGFEPIECAFGEGSVLGPLAMDHHGPESWREGVALRACRDHYGARQDDPRFVVTGTADADATLAIIALSGLVPQNNLDPTFYELVNRRDLDPIHIDLLDEPKGEELLAFQQTEKLRRDGPSFYRAIHSMQRLLLQGLTPAQRDRIRRREERRITLANQCIQEQEHPSVLCVESNVWGFDQWYRKAPIVVSYSRRHESITIGCKDIEQAQALFGKEGLLTVFRQLGPGWGGRETVGGSPRDQRFTAEDAQHVARRLPSMLLTQHTP